MDADPADFDRLIRLQELDSALRHASLFLDSIPRLVQEIDQKIQAGSAVVAAARDRLAKNQKSRRDLEGEVKDAKTQISKYKRQLSEVKSNREYTSLLHEIEEAQRGVDAIEEKIIAEMLAADDIEVEIKSALRQQGVEEERLRKDKDALLERKGEMEGKHKALSADREALLPGLSPDLVRLYESVRGKKGGVALSAVKGEFCSACHMRIRPQMINEIRERARVVTCENCGRILYWDLRAEGKAEPGEEAAPATAPEAPAETPEDKTTA